MGEDFSRHADEVNALKLGLDLGMTLIDTAEMYASGGAEEVVADAIAGRRDEVFLVSKVLPSNASRIGVPAACDRSLRHLRTDRIDLYLLHWPGSVPLAETVEAFDALKKAGKIRHWAVSNFDTHEMEELVSLPAGDSVQTNQILYNLSQRGPEFDLAPWSRQRGIPLMAYSPVDQGVLARNTRLEAITALHNATAAQLALAWVMAQDGVIAIPKAGKQEHVRQNVAALHVELTPEDFADIDRAFPPPRRKQGLQMI